MMNNDITTQLFDNIKMLTMTNVSIIKHNYKCTTTIEWAVVEQSHRKKGYMK